MILGLANAMPDELRTIQRRGVDALVPLDYS